MLGALILLAVVRVKERSWPRLSLRDAGILLVQSFVGVFLFSICLMYGLRWTTALEGGIITSTTPAAVAIVSLIFLKEKPSRTQLLGIFLAVTGALLINVFGLQELKGGGGMQAILGNLLVLGAVFGEAVFLTFGKLVSDRVSPLVISASLTSIGAVLFLPMAVYQSLSFSFAETTVSDWLLLAYAGTVVTVCAVLLMNEGMKEAQGGAAAVLTGIMPVSTVILSFTVLREPFHLHHAAGIALVLVAILFMANRSGGNRLLAEPGNGYVEMERGQ